MEFDKSRVYTALNADELKIGSKVICGDELATIKEYVEGNDNIVTLARIRGENCEYRFLDFDDNTWGLAYLVSEPEEKKLQWTDLKIGDVIRKKYEDGYCCATVIRIDTYSTRKHIGLGGEWLTADELENWEKVED